MLTPSRTALNSLARLMTGNASITVTKTLSGAQVGLLKAPFAYTPDSSDTIVTSNKADYTGYALQNISAWTGPYVNSSQQSVMSGGAKVWEASDTVSLNTIYGQYLVGSDSTTVLGVEFFTNPIPIGSASVGFTTVPIFACGPNPNGYGNGIVGP